LSRLIILGKKHPPSKKVDIFLVSDIYDRIENEDKQRYLKSLLKEK